MQQLHTVQGVLMSISKEKTTIKDSNKYSHPPDPRTYIAIDMKSFYASVECVCRGYDRGTRSRKGSGF